MKLWLTPVLLFILVSPSLADVDAAKLARIDAIAESQIQKGNVPGAVVVVLHNDAVVYRKAFGHRQLAPDKKPMTPDAVFDLASLTKPLATGTAVMLLIEQGKLRPADPVAKHWPAFAANGKADVTIEHCLLHAAGLIPDNAIKDYAGTRDEMLARVADLKLEAPAGTRFKYSDVGFIVLGDLVEKLGGAPVDAFARKHVFAPHKMTDTTFNPPAELKPRVAPTGRRKGEIILGEVHDPRAHYLGGVAGHAGLFSTADDVARYCRMLLRGGELDGIRVLSADTVKAFTAAHPVPAGLTKDGKPDEKKLARSLGWDVDTGFSAQRGDGFTKGDGYGHTGFTGTSVWIDPPSKTAVIILANRVHPDDKGNMTPLRREIGTIVASAVRQ